jgi:biotin transport system substrate-specific component
MERAMTTETISPARRSSLSIASRMLAPVALVGGGVLALTLSAKLQVAFWPVPMTLQSLVVLLVGVAYGARLGALTALAYLALGAAGAPVFAGAGAGLPYFLGPTAGFLVGFLPAAALAGWLRERGWAANFVKAVAIMTAGHVLMFVAGLLWLQTIVGVQQAVAAGLLPFIPSTLAKIALGAALVVAWRRLRRAD